MVKQRKLPQVNTLRYFRFVERYRFNPNMLRLKFAINELLLANSPNCATFFVLQAELSPVAARLPKTDASAHLLKIDAEK